MGGGGERGCVGAYIHALALKMSWGGVREAVGWGMASRVSSWGVGGGVGWVGGRGWLLVGEVEGEDEARQDGGALEDDQLRVDGPRAGPVVRGAGDVIGGRALLVHVDDVRVVLGHLRAGAV